MKLVLLDPVVASHPLDGNLNDMFLIISFIALFILILIFYLVRRKNKK